MQMSQEIMNPARIRTAMRLQFSLQPSELPALQKAQNFVCYYRRTKLGGSDTSADIAAAIRARAFSGREDEHEPFSFGSDVADKGELTVGNGSGKKPFLVGFSSKALLRQAARDASSFIFHVDATYKTNQVGYPVLVCGISDATKTFHLLALFITSQQQEGRYTKALAALRGDGAQYNTVERVFGGDCNYVHLMCYCHRIAKVIERTKGLPIELSDAVLRDVYDVHFSRNAEEYSSFLTAAQHRWLGNTALKPFHACFQHVWLNERFCRWQCYRSPVGYATTNNPVELFNRALKQDYTAHRLLKMGELMMQLAACCRQRAIAWRPFTTKPAPSKEILAWVRALRSQQWLRDYTVPRMSLEFQLEDDSDVVQVLYTPPPSVTRRVNAWSRPKVYSFNVPSGFEGRSWLGCPVHKSTPVGNRSGVCPL